MVAEATSNRIKMPVEMSEEADVYDKIFREKCRYRNKRLEDFVEKYLNYKLADETLDLEDPNSVITVDPKTGKFTLHNFGHQSDYGCKSVSKSIGKLLKEVYDENKKEIREKHKSSLSESNSCYTEMVPFTKSLFKKSKFQLSSIGLDASKQNEEVLSGNATFDSLVISDLHLSELPKIFGYDEKYNGRRSVAGKIHKVKNPSTKSHLPIKDVKISLKSIFPTKPLNLKNLGLDCNS